MAGEQRQPEAEGRDEALTRAGEESKGWGRASIRLRTHPLHPFPDLTSADLLLPYRPDALKLAGDCVLAGLAFAGLAFFPLLLLGLGTPYDLGPWFWRAVGAVGLAGALYVFCRAWFPDTRDLDRF